MRALTAAQAIYRHRGGYAHVLDESIDPHHDAATGDACCRVVSPTCCTGSAVRLVGRRELSILRGPHSVSGA